MFVYYINGGCLLKPQNKSDMQYIHKTKAICLNNGYFLPKKLKDFYCVFNKENADNVELTYLDNFKKLLIDNKYYNILKDSLDSVLILTPKAKKEYEYYFKDSILEFTALGSINNITDIKYLDVFKKDVDLDRKTFYLHNQLYHHINNNNNNSQALQEALFTKLEVFLDDLQQHLQTINQSLATTPASQGSPINPAQSSEQTKIAQKIATFKKTLKDTNEKIKKNTEKDIKIKELLQKI